MAVYERLVQDLASSALEFVASSDQLLHAHTGKSPHFAIQRAPADCKSSAPSKDRTFTDKAPDHWRISSDFTATKSWLLSNSGRQTCTDTVHLLSVHPQERTYVPVNRLLDFFRDMHLNENQSFTSSSSRLLVSLWFEPLAPHRHLRKHQHCVRFGFEQRLRMGTNVWKFGVRVHLRGATFVERRDLVPLDVQAAAAACATGI